MNPLMDGCIVDSMEQDDLLSTLRNLEPEPVVSLEAEILEKLEFTNNLLEDLKLKQSITNECLLELLEVMRNRSGSDHAARARPTRNTGTGC